MSASGAQSTEDDPVTKSLKETIDAVTETDADFNTLMQDGVYQAQSTPDGCPNSPLGDGVYSHFFQVHYHADGWIVQVAYRVDLQGVYTRNRLNGVWSAWRKIATEETLTTTVPVAWGTTGDIIWEDVSVPGMLVNGNPIADILPGGDNAANKLYAEAWEKVLRATTYDGGVQRYGAPQWRFNVQFKVVR